MGCEAGHCNRTFAPEGIFIVIPSLKGWPTKAKEALSPHEVRLTPLDTNPVFQCLGESICLAQQCTRKLPVQCWPMANRQHL